MPCEYLPSSAQSHSVKQIMLSILFILALVGICSATPLEHALQAFRDGMVGFMERPDFEQLRQFPPTFLVEDEEMAILFNYLSLQMTEFYIELSSASESSLVSEEIHSLELPVIKRLLLLSLNTLADVDFSNPNSIHPLLCSFETKTYIEAITNTRNLIQMGVSSLSRPKENFKCTNQIPLYCVETSDSFPVLVNFNRAQLERTVTRMNGGRPVLPHLEFDVPLASNTAL